MTTVDPTLPPDSAAPGPRQHQSDGAGTGPGPRRDQSAGAATGLAMAGAVVTTVANFGLAVMVARTSAVFAGLFFAATAVATILGNSAGLGTMTGLVYFMPEARRGPRPNPKGLLAVAIGPVALVGLAAGGLLVLGSRALGGLLAADHVDDLAPMLLALAPAVPAWSLTMTMLGATRGLGTMTPTVAVNQVGRPLAQLVGVAAVLYWQGAATPWAVAAAWTVPVVGGAVASLVFLWRLGGLDGAGPSVVPGREFWHYTRPRSLSTMFQIALERLDVILVSALAGPGLAGIYGTLTRYITAANFLVFSIGQAVAPGLRRTLQTGRSTPAPSGTGTGPAKDLLQRSTGWMVLVAWPYLLAVALKPGPLVGLLNPDFAGEGAALAVLGLFMLATAAAGPADLALLMLGRSRAALAAVALALGLDVLLALALVPRFGLIGAAVAWGVAVVAQNLVATFLVHRSAGLVAFGRPAALAGIGAVLCVVPVGLATPDTFTGLVVTAAVSGPLYLLWLARFSRPLGLRSPRAGRNPDPLGGAAATGG